MAVDTDGDRVTDTYLPGTSNFAAGFIGRATRNGVTLVREEDSKILYAPKTICHEADCGQHCPSGVEP